MLFVSSNLKIQQDTDQVRKKADWIDFRTFFASFHACALNNGAFVAASSKGQKVMYTLWTARCSCSGGGII